MRVAIHQPQYFPYPGFFHKLSLVDTFVIMDDTQYDKRFTNRNLILDSHGQVWLTVPINKAHKFSANRFVEINNALPWRQEHWKKILVSYANAKYFNLYKELESVYQREWSNLFDLNLHTIKMTMAWLGVDIPVIRESELHVQGESTERLVNLTKAVGADTYVSGIGGKDYLKESLFEDAHLRLEYQSYHPTPYPQRFTKVFVPNLSILDMLANVGPDCLRVIREAGTTTTTSRGDAAPFTA
jgi:hypothetical protein